jgi:hypothetical protein
MNKESGKPWNAPTTVSVHVVSRPDLGDINLLIRWVEAPYAESARNTTRLGYTTRRGVPIGFMLRIAGRWYRPRTVCYSNVGTTFVRSKRFPTLALGSVLVPNGKPSSNEDIAAWERRLLDASKAERKG